MDKGQNVDIKKYDMQFLTTIYNKVQKGYKLTKEELRFLYEIDHKIEGFGYGKDPRIKEIKSKRNIKKDLACIFDCKEEEVCLGGDLPKDKTTKVYWGFLFLIGLTSAEALELPEYIGGSLFLIGLTSAESLDLSNTSIGGSLWLYSLTSAEGLTLPKHIKGNLYLNNLTSAEGLKLSENFDIEKLIAPGHIKEEIKNHPEKYYIQRENKDNLSKVEDQIVDTQDPTKDTKVLTETAENLTEIAEDFTEEPTENLKGKGPLKKILRLIKS